MPSTLPFCFLDKQLVPINGRGFGAWLNTSSRQFISRPSFKAFIASKIAGSNMDLSTSLKDKISFMKCEKNPFVSPGIILLAI